MRIALGFTALVTAALSGQLLAANGGVITFRGAIVEPTCHISVGAPSATSSSVQVSRCNQPMTLNLKEPRNSAPAVNYRLTDAQGKPVGQFGSTAGDTNAVIQAVSKRGDNGRSRNLVLVAEYL